MAEPVLTELPVEPAVSLDDYAARARAVLPPDVWDYVAGGSAAEVTLAANRSALDRVAVLPRMLRGVNAVDLSTRLLGRPYAMPVGVAPMAYQRLLHPDGELALAAAAGAAGVPYLASTLGSTPIELVAGTGAEVWFQLYWLRDRALVRDLLDRVVAAGCRALVVTVDVPVLGRRPRDLRNAFRLPAEVVAANLPDGRDDLAHAGAPGVSAIAAHTHAAFAPALRWADLAWLREHLDLPLVVKGVLDPGTRSRRYAPARTRWSSPTTVADSWMGCRPASPCSRRSSTRSATAARCSWTVASAAAPTCCGRSRWAPPGCWSVGRCSGHWPLAASRPRGTRWSCSPPNCATRSPWPAAPTRRRPASCVPSRWVDRWPTPSRRT
ncbi:hypothetical protein GCM10027614_12130 [Micromonospora vulcania]